MKRVLLSVLMIAFALSFVGCRTAMIENIPGQAIVEDKKNVTDEQVFKAIVRSGAELGWIVRRIDNNTAEATLNIRDHQAVVTISFSTKEYSIKYKSSINLRYDAATNSIHSNYNGWVKKLNNKIQVQLTLL